MKRAEITELLNEPACAHNQGSKSGCARLKPGATAGGCSFDGAQITLFPIGDALHIVHGAIGCAGASWDGRGALSSGLALHRLGLTTDLSEQDVIMGRGEKKLLHGIRYALKRHPEARAVFVYQTCIPALTGDDLETVCRTAGEAFGLPVIPVDAAGFYGTKNLGNRIAGAVVAERIAGTREPDPIPDAAERPGVTVHNVALIGEFNIAGEFWAVLPLFDEVGLRILGTLSGDARFSELQTIHRAAATMLVCSKALINVARILEERYAIPWFEGSFYGVHDTSQAFRDFARLLKDPGLSARVEQMIAREEAAIRTELAPWRERLAGKRVLLYTGGVKSWSVVSALQELGLEVVATGTKKSTEQDKARIRQLMGAEAVMIDDGAPRLLLDLAIKHRADLLMAGGRNMYTAVKARLPFLDINQEREFPYAGYRGMVTLARELVRTLESPVWELARHPAPWETAIKGAAS